MIKVNRGHGELEGTLFQLMGEAVVAVQAIAAKIDETPSPKINETLKKIFVDTIIDAIYLDPEEHSKRILQEAVEEFAKGLGQMVERSAEDD
jgi:hypothetical protein